MAGYTDTSELDALVKDLRRAPRGAIRQMRQCVRKGAINIKRDARQTIKGLMSGKSAIRYYPTSITYDFIATGKKIYAEIGPETGKQGSLGLSLIHI